MLNGYSKLASKAKFRSIYGKERSSDIATRLKILTAKEMLQRLQTALAQVNAGNTSKNLLNEFIYSVYREKEVIKKVYNNIMNSMKL